MVEATLGRKNNRGVEVTLADQVHIERRFHRSIRIDQDLQATEAVEGYILQHSGAEVLREVGRTIGATKQRAFTITGPYGGGKSSLALVLAQFLSRDKEQRQAAEKVLGKSLCAELRAVFPFKKGWLLVPVQGRRANPLSDIAQALSSATSRTATKRINQERELIAAIDSAAKDSGIDGLLIILDELGKHLEAVADGDGDIHLFQELAEAAGRSTKPVVIIGVLHQAFDAYVSRRGGVLRDEWAKVQGRYVDIPFRSAPEESMYLLGRAIQTSKIHSHTWAISKAVAGQLASRRLGVPEDLIQRLDETWPLHPLMPGLLGAFSKKRFGQNERSIFGFLTSQEPHGFQAFLREHPAGTKELFEPSRFWDYLRGNLEPTILASGESHRWSLAVQTVERAEACGTEIQVKLAKTIAVMDFFGPGDPGASLPVLCSCLPEEPKATVTEALQELERSSAIIYRKHLQSWAVFAGSDFDLNGALLEARERLTGIDLSRLSRLAPVGPIVAKRHYHSTGALRWFSFDIARSSDLDDWIKRDEKDGRSGRFLLVLPGTSAEAEGVDTVCHDASERCGDRIVAVGAPRNAGTITELGLDLLALHHIRETDSRLLGDVVARREVQGHFSDLELRLESALNVGFTSANWFVRGNRFEVTGKDSLTAMASNLCNQSFDKTPYIFSELVNRHRPTRNSQAGVRELMYRMVKNSGDKFLGIEGYPAERGLYDTVIANAGLHRPEGDSGYEFYGPSIDSKDGKSYLPFWSEGEKWLREMRGLTSVQGLFDRWSSPPFGLHEGVLPILGLAFLLSHRDELAIHVESVFQTEDDLGEGTFVDCLYRDADLIQVRHVPPSDPSRRKLLAEVSQALGIRNTKTPTRDALPLAQHLKSFSDRLQPWVHKTKKLSKGAGALRQLLQKASDPNKLLFEDLPAWERVNGGGRGLRKALAEAMDELASAYEIMLRSIEASLWEALGVETPVDFQRLHARAQKVHGVSGDLRMDAFAGRLAELDGSVVAIEGLCAFAMNRPTRDWLGNDPDQARFQIVELADRFRKAETFAEFCGGDPGRQGLALIVREGKKYNTMIQYFDVGDEDRGRLKQVVASFKKTLNDAGLNPRMKLAALATVTADLLSSPKESQG